MNSVPDSSATPLSNSLLLNTDYLYLTNILVEEFWYLATEYFTRLSLIGRHTYKVFPGIMVMNIGAEIIIVEIYSMLINCQFSLLQALPS